MVFGVRAEKDKISIVIIEGNQGEPIYKDGKRLNVTINVSKTIESRGEALVSIKKEFEELLNKYNPKIIAIKDAENSQHSKILPNIQRGEVEGVLQLICFENNIIVEKLLYTHIKSRLGLSKKSKDYLYEEVMEKFKLEKLDDKHKDALLSAWAVLNG